MFLQVLSTTRSSGYLAKPIGVKGDLKGDVRSVLIRHNKKLIVKEHNSLFASCSRFWRDSMFSGLLRCQGTWWNALKLMTNSMEASSVPGFHLLGKSHHLSLLDDTDTLFVVVIDLNEIQHVYWQG